MNYLIIVCCISCSVVLLSLFNVLSLLLKIALISPHSPLFGLLRYILISSHRVGVTIVIAFHSSSILQCVVFTAHHYPNSLLLCNLYQSHLHCCLSSIPSLLWSDRIFFAFACYLLLLLFVTILLPWSVSSNISFSMEMNPLDKASQNEKCVVCRANKYMINLLKETIKDFKFDSKAENSFLKRQLHAQNKEITTLKHKCKHTEETVNYMKGLIINQTGKNSNYKSNKIRPHSQQEPSVNKY